MASLKQIRRRLSSVVGIIERKLPVIASMTEREDGGLKLVARLKRVYNLATHVKRHRKVVAALNQPNIRKGLNGQPHLVVKYLHPRYLVRGLATNDKARTVIHHFKVLQKYFSPRFIDSLTETGVVIWEHEEAGAVHALVMRYAHPIDNEGEIVLEYRYDDALIYVASFAFAPGTIANLPDRTVLLITRLQGERESFERISLAMKSLRGLSGSSVLIAAMQGIAGSLTIKTMLGPAAEAQACYADRLHSSFVSMYDDFFTRLNGLRITPSLYSIALPVIEKPLSEVKASNRSKVRAQRDYKRRIAEEIRLFLRDQKPSLEAPESGVQNIAA